MYDLMWQNAQRWKESGGADAIPEPPPDPDVISAAVLLWEEHCIECAIPECYTTCSLHVPRLDHKCARFVYGIYPNRSVRGLLQFGADVSFRRWGKLEAQFPGRPRLATRDALHRLAAREIWMERSANVVSDLLQPINPKRRANGLVRAIRAHRMRHPASETTAAPDALFVKFFSPTQEPGDLVVEAHQDQLVFRDSIPFRHGWTERAIPFSQLQLNPAKNVRLFVAPANDRSARLVITWLDLVVFRARQVPPARPTGTASGASVVKPAAKVKCVVWDLDNTLWRGVIGDLGPEGVTPSPEALELVRALDERGIIQGVASKNDYDVAWSKIEEMGLADYLLYPAIHWGPKSQSLLGIADKLNIGVETFALIDDSAFERGEVASSLPQVRVYDATEMGQLLGQPEFDIPITEMSRARRLSYLVEAKRQRVAATWGADYEGFLRSCGMVMRIGAPRPEHKARCLELIQRTNQLNLSSKRYGQPEFDERLADNHFQCFAFDCADKFGEYGLVGFASVEVTGPVPILRDFVLSCRVAQKRIEEAFVYWYGRRAKERGADRLRAVFVPTSRNRPLRDALAELPFKLIENTDAGQIFEMPLAEPLEAPDIVRVDAL